MNENHDNPLGDPEIVEVMKETILAVQNESDRGSLLISAEIVNRHLTLLFHGIAPSVMSKKDRERLLEYPGCLHSFAAKNDIAFMTGLIAEDLYSAINYLRQIRNKAAHDAQDFLLNDHKTKIHAMYELLGTGISGVVRNVAVKMLLGSFVEQVLDRQKNETEEVIRTLFTGPDDVIDTLLASPEAVKTFEEKSARIELGVAVTLICALLLSYRREERSLKRR